jgi:taurine dehydrogenase small subunit
MREEKITVQFLDAFAEAFNRHDVKAILAAMTEDCVFEASAGPDVCGRRYEGPQEVGKAFAEVFETFPDAQWRDARHFFVGDRGLSEWTFSGTRADGTRVEVTGCDVFTFRDGKIAVKDSYRKQRT